MPRAYALTTRRLARTREYVLAHMNRSIPGISMVADRFETPLVVRRVMTRIYGRPRRPGDGETAYWLIDDDGSRLGIELPHR